MPRANPTRLTVTLQGPLVDENRLPLSELQRIAKHIRLALRDIATVMSHRGPSGRGGRVDKFIEEATDLRVVGRPRAGSFKLELEVPTQVKRDPELPADFGPGLAEDAVGALVQGVASLDEDADQLPPGFDRGVLREISPLDRALRKGIDAIELKTNGHRKTRRAEITKKQVSAARALVRKPIRAQATVEGVLQMVDFKALECRIDRPPHPSVRCVFTEDNRDVVHQAVRQYVRVSGEAEFEPDRVDPTRLDAESIEILYEAIPFDSDAFGKRRSLRELTEAQAPRVFRAADVDDEDPWRDDEEATALIAAIHGDE